MLEQLALEFLNSPTARCSVEVDNHCDLGVRPTIDQLALENDPVGVRMDVLIDEICEMRVLIFDALIHSSSSCVFR